MQKHKKRKTCKKSNKIKKCTSAPAISTSYLLLSIQNFGYLLEFGHKPFLLNMFSRRNSFPRTPVQPYGHAPCCPHVYLLVTGMIPCHQLLCRVCHVHTSGYTFFMPNYTSRGWRYNSALAQQSCWNTGRRAPT